MAKTLDELRNEFEDKINWCAETLDEQAETLTGMTMYNEVDYKDMICSVDHIIRALKDLEDHT
jgi:hypothetical protein